VYTSQSASSGVGVSIRYLGLREVIRVGLEILISLLGGLLSLSAGGVVASELIQRSIRKLFGKEQKQETLSHRDKLAKLTESLMTASRDVDAVLLELSQVARDREKAVERIETDLVNLQEREKELQKRIETLQNVPLPVADYFAQISVSGEKRSAKRDYVLFGSGVIVSTVIAILLKILGWG
jgi:septal ring factor EnvC (AmiA/AmiB activator)